MNLLKKEKISEVVQIILGVRDILEIMENSVIQQIPNPALELLEQSLGMATQLLIEIAEEK